MIITFNQYSPMLVFALALGACQTSSDPIDGDSAADETGAHDTDSGEPGTVPREYTFASRFTEGGSVSYSGQVFRHVLIEGLKDHLGKMTARIDEGTFIPADGQVEAELNLFYTFDSAIGGGLPLGMELAMPMMQAVYDDISTDKDLQGKIAGKDEVGQYKDWNSEFVGWSGAANPDALVQLWFAAVEDLAIERSLGTIPNDPLGNPIEAVYVTADGRDYQQLLQKFLLGAVAFSQATDDYLDDDLPGKGLLSDHTGPEEGEPFTALEHGWDEAFGYFGAARDYLAYTDEELAAKGGRQEFAAGYHDATGDGLIDLKSEFNFGHAVNAAKRDLGSSEASPTDFSTATMEAFLTGRHIIAQADAALSTEQLDELRIQRDIIVDNWERAISSTVVHYINELLVDMSTFDTAEYSFADHAKHWSELKGFALSLQFNPRSPVSPDDFKALHDKIGDAPVLVGQEGVDAYKAGLIEARAIIADAYRFDASNVGDENGEGGW